MNMIFENDMKMIFENDLKMIFEMKHVCPDKARVLKQKLSVFPPGH